MKALIFNSGLGNRMGEFTRANHKSMARLANGETIFARQLRILADHGVTEFVITTGPFVEQLLEQTQTPDSQASISRSCRTPYSTAQTTSIRCTLRVRT